MDIKQEVSKHYAYYKSWIEQSNHIDNVKKYFVKHLNSVEKFMLSEDYSNGKCWSGRTWLEEFIYVTKRLDKIRDQNIINVVPQLTRLFNENNQ